MKKRLICLLALTALLLTGCGQAAPAPTTEAAMEAPTEAPTTVATEPPCAHQWSEAAYFTPAVCALCGEEGEQKQPYFVEQGLNIVDAPADHDLEAFLHNEKNTSSEPAIIHSTVNSWAVIHNDSGSQEVRLELNIERYAKFLPNGTLLDQCDFTTGIYDYYTGQWLHEATEAKNGEDVGVVKVEIDGKRYKINYSNTFSRYSGETVKQQDGSSIVYSPLSDYFRLNLGGKYDGLVYGVIPTRDTRGAHMTEDGEFITHISEEPFYEEGLYFRINPPGADGYIIDPNS